MTRQGRISAATLAALLIIAGAACDGKPSPGDGTRSTAGGDGGFEFPAEPERIVIEAEAGVIGAPFQVEEDATVSGGKCVVLAEVWATHEELNPAFRTREGGEPVSKEGLAENPLGRALVPNGVVEVPFEVKKAGSYTFWTRAWFSGSCGDSFFFSVDEDPPVDTDGDGAYDERPPHMLSGSTHEKWKWFERRKVRFDLDQGPHVLRIYPREDGLRIDQVFFGEVLEGVDLYLPQGTEEPTAPGPGPSREKEE